MPGLMKRFWAAQLEVLEDISKVCRDNNIKWFADYGTLLGAVRHGGFIPWDDDLDICMLREDYDRFNMVAREALPGNYSVLNYHSENYWDNTTRVINSMNLIFDEKLLNKYHDCIYPAGIDIFCLDYISEDDAAENKRKELARLVMSSAVSCDFTLPLNRDTVEILHSIEAVCKVSFTYDDTLREQLYELGEKYFKMFSRDGAKRVALMNYWLDLNNHIYPIKSFEGDMKLTFEGMEVPVPLDYYGKLEADYGNYVSVNRKSGIHDYPMYASNQQLFMKALGDKYPFTYRFRPSDFNNEDRGAWQQRADKCRSLLTDMSKVMECIGSAKSAGNENDSGAELLERLQNMVIECGNTVEMMAGEDAPQVLSAQELCETVFQCYTGLAETEVYNREMIHLLDDYNRFIEQINALLCSDITLFMICHARDWQVLEAFYEKEKAGGRQVFVLVLPYYDRDAGGMMRCENYEGEAFGTELTMLNYKNVNLRSLHPGKIVTCIGQDYCGYTETVNPQYYTGVIKAYTDELIYVSPYITGEYKPDDAKGKVSIEEYVCVPAMAHCDKVYVHSRNMRNAYIDLLTEHYGPEYADVWQQKIECFEQSNPYNKCEDKKLFIYFSAATIAWQGKKAVDKIAEVAAEVAEHAVDVMWYMSKGEAEYLKAHNRELYEAYISILNAGNSELTEASQAEIEKEAENCCAYYGEVGPVLKHFRDRKPVMIADMS